MSQFIGWLTKVSAGNSKVRAVLRRSLGFEPGEFPPAFPYVEPFLVTNHHGWTRLSYYLVAGLWAHHYSPERESTGDVLSIARAAGALDRRSREKLTDFETGDISSTERRFISLIDADEGQLTYRLRQMVALLKDFPIDWERLLADLRWWNSTEKKVQQRWAREYYRALANENGTETESSTEEKEESRT